MSLPALPCFVFGQTPDGSEWWLMGQAGEIKKARIVEGGVHLVAVEVVLVVVWISSAT